MATIFKPLDMSAVFSPEMTSEIDTVVESWMAAVDRALNHPDLTTLGRMYAAQEVLDDYKRATGKNDLQPGGPRWES
jgi:hypothetical protein